MCECVFVCVCVWGGGGAGACVTLYWVTVAQMADVEIVAWNLITRLPTVLGSFGQGIGLDDSVQVSAGPGVRACV